MKENELFRHELKYLLNYNDYSLAKQRLSAIMKPDQHAVNGFYKIRSLYFDDYWHSSYTEKVTGVNDRKKYRIRIYNDSGSLINLEKKKKIGSYICKTSAALSRAETDSILNGDYRFLLKKDNDLCREFYYQCVSKVMRPSVIVDYEREPLILSAGDTRVTFDRNIRSSTMFQDFFEPDIPVSYAFDDCKLVMEVKFTQLLPKIVKDALPCRSSEYAAVSKFTRCFEKSVYFNPMQSSALLKSE